jgi:quercetin 2,3-dioxygenase
MTAGRGIVHSEMPEQENGLMWGFQLWVNLPARDKMTAPRYQDIEPEAIPQVALPGGVTVRVLAGMMGNHYGPAHAEATDPVYLDVALPAGSDFEYPLPAGHNAFAYVFEGAAEISGTRVERGTLAVLGNGEVFRVGAGDAPARLILVAGKPIGEKVVKYGPFVMNTPEEIYQALEDYNAGRF